MSCVSALESFQSLPQELGLYSAPRAPIVVRDEVDRPQPKLDRDAGNGMTITIGRLMPDTVLDYRFVVLSHNTIRGAAGAAILNAELLIALGHLNRMNKIFRMNMIRFAKLFAVLLVLSFSAAAQSQQTLDDQVKPIVASFKGKVSLFAKNLDTGETYALNPG